jgi:hypothetical protein
MSNLDQVRHPSRDTDDHSEPLLEGVAAEHVPDGWEMADC